MFNKQSKEDSALCDYILNSILFNKYESNKLDLFKYVKYDNVDTLSKEIENLIKIELIKSMFPDILKNNDYYKITPIKEEIKKSDDSYDFSFHNYNTFDLYKTARPIHPVSHKIVTG